MAYLLLCAESLTVSLLLVATIATWTARWRFRGLGALVLTLVLLLGLTTYGALTGLAALAYGYLSSFAWGLASAGVLVVGFLVGTIVIYIRGLRRRGGMAPAASWSRGKLALAFLVVAWMHVMTFWVMDLSIRQQGANLRAQAAGLIISAATPRLADSDNAAFDYKAALEAFGPEEELPDEWHYRWTDWSDPNAAPDPNDPQLRAFLRDKGEALRLLRHAATKSGCWDEQNIDPTDPLSMMPNTLWAYRLGGLLGLSARVRAADGDANGAVEDINAMIALAGGVGAGGPIIRPIIGIAIDGCALKTMQAMADGGKLGAAELGRVRVDEGLSWQRQFRRAMLWEEAFRLTVLAAVAGDTVSLTGLGFFDGVSLLSGPGVPELNRRAAEYAYRLFILPRDIEDNARISARLRGFAAKPYPKAADGWEKLRGELGGRSTGPLTSMMIPGYSHTIAITAEADARRLAASAAVAACRYRIARGQWPDRLDDLVPEYLIVTPIDPFAGKVLRWKSGGEKIVIYSVGPDGKDDGGAAYDSKAKTGDIVFLLRK